VKRRIKINEDVWCFKIVDSVEMSEHRPDGDTLAGLCIANEKLILIHEEHVDLNTIMHEMVHAYWSYLYLEDTNTIPIIDFEEIVCGFVVDKSESIIKKARQLTKALKKLQEEE
jgi:chemotaxis signal transduction protein